MTIDREVTEMLSVKIFATNTPPEPESGAECEDNEQGCKTQWMSIDVTVEDLKDTPPRFKGLSEDGFITGGFSTSKQTDDEIGTVEAEDLDINDYVRFEITSGFEASDPALPTDGYPFILSQPEDDINNTAKIILRFDPQPYHKGHYTFKITAKDSGTQLDPHHS